MGRKNKNTPPENIIAEVRDMSHQGEAIVYANERTYFVDGALPDEEITFIPNRKHKGHYQGKLVEIMRLSEYRASPPCDYFGICGGCVLQHYQQSAQIQFKQKLLTENLQRIAKLTPQTVLPPIVASDTGYRRRARLGVKYVPAKGGVIVGFRERKNSFITPLKNCLVLDQRIAKLLPSLASTIAQLSPYQAIPQVEVAAADNAIAIIIRHLKALTPNDETILAQYAQQYDIQIFLQSAGLDSIKLLATLSPEPLYYSLSRDIKIYFLVSDFIQVNAAINLQLIDEVLKHLSSSAADTVLDLFCGLGNFSLPIAKMVATVYAIEGDKGLVSRAIENATVNNINNVHFSQQDLFEQSLPASLPLKKINKLVIDPPRSGAWQVVSQMVPQIKPEKIIYVSCNPATLARDAAALIEQGYRLTIAGIADMFPHTAHVESIAVFTKS